jgi:hypothetical protein
LGVGREAPQPHTVKIKLFRNSEEDQGSQRAVMPVMMMMMMMMMMMKIQKALRLRYRTQPVNAM